MTRFSWPTLARRVALVSVVLVMGALVGSRVVPELLPAASAQACGTVLVPGTSWLGGDGVDVHSNGDKQTSGTGCANGDTEVYDLNAQPPVFGYAWQCVELANRLYATRGWFPKLWLGPDTNSGAKWLFTYAQAGKYSGLTAHSNGSGYHPVTGDMIVHSNGIFGHVAVVDQVEDSEVLAVEQNNDPSGRATYAYDAASGAVSRPGAVIVGFIHAERNDLGSSHATDSTPSTAVGGSHVQSDTAGVEVALRSCGGGPQAGDSQPECGDLIERLPDGTHVDMRCWLDSTPPIGYKSPRWFYVNEGADGPHPGWSGFVYSDLVEDQTTTPHCDADIVARYQMPKPTSQPMPDLDFKVVGSCTTSGGTLTAQSANFTPGGRFEVSAAYPDGSAYRLTASEGTVHDDGSVTWRWPCAGDPPGTYETSLVDLSTGRDVEANFTIGSSESSDNGSSSSPPRPGPTGGSAPPPVPAPTTPAQPPPPPASANVTVYNMVTNGRTQMREDDAPAYLSSAPRNFCRRDNCALPGTDVGSGAHLDAVCQTEGARTTNGEDSDPVDDGNPGLYSSTRWYGVRWTDGRFGYISEVWVQPSDRGGRNLPAC